MKPAFGQYGYMSTSRPVERFTNYMREEEEREGG